MTCVTDNHIWRVGFVANVRYLPEVTGPRRPSRSRAIHQNEPIDAVPTADHDLEAGAGELHALQAEARWKVRREHAAEAVRRLRIRRPDVAVVVQRLGGRRRDRRRASGPLDDHAVMEKWVQWMTHATPELTDSTLIARPSAQGA